MFNPPSLTLAALAVVLGVAALACEPTPVYVNSELIWDEDPIEGQEGLHRIHEQTSGTRVMWWNIMGGQLNQKLAGAPLDHNLVTILEDAAIRPDVLAIGECRYDAIAEATWDKLIDTYPYRSIRPYNDESPDIGICVLSKYPLKEPKGVALDWTPLDLDSESEREAYRQKWRDYPSYNDVPAEAPKEAVKHFTRTYLPYEIQLDGWALHFVPFHDLMPWNILKAQLGSIDTARIIERGEGNPLVYQVKRLLQNLRRDFGKHIDEQPLLVTGDFNVPKHLVGIEPMTTHAYSLMARDLSEAFSDEPFTFPAASDDKRDSLPYEVLRLKLDHAFVSTKTQVLSAEVLRLRGSDHYPIYVVVGLR